MRRFLLSAVLALGSMVAQAQDGVWGATSNDSLKCWESYNIFGSLFNSKSYAEAYDAWNVVYTTCPQAKEIIYIYGPKVIEAKIKATTDEAAKSALVDQLFRVYDDRLKYFPGKEAYVLASKADDYYSYHPDSLKVVYDLFQKAYASDAYELSPTHLNRFFLVAVKLYNEKTIEVSELFDVYNQATEALEYHNNVLNKEIAELQTQRDSGTIDAKGEKTLKRDEALLKNYDIVSGNIEKSLAPLLSCERLAIIYSEEAFEKNKGNAVWLRRASTMLAKERQDENGDNTDCTDNSIYFKVAEALYAMEPSAKSARSMGKLSVKMNNYSKGAEYFNQAISLELDPIKRAEDYLKLATIQQKLGSLSAAKQSCLKAASLRKEWGDPYLVLASIYQEAAGTCGNDAFEKNAVYWAAIDKCNYAKSIDPSSAKKADRLIAVYKKGVPDKAVSFTLGHKEGDRYTIGCWINESVVVKFY